MSQTYVPTFTAIAMGLRCPQTPGVEYILLGVMLNKRAPGDQKMAEKWRAESC